MDRIKTTQEEIKSGYGRRKKHHRASNLLLSPWERWSSGFFLCFSRAFPPQCPGAASLTHAPFPVLVSAECWGINLTSENAPAGVKGKLAWAKASSALLPCHLGLPHHFSCRSSASYSSVSVPYTRIGLERGNSQFPASAIPPLDTPFLLFLAYE